MKKRGQIEQIFIFVFIAVVIALLFLFGSDAIVKVFSLGKDVETEKFIQDLKQQIELVHTYNIGSKVSLENIKIPDQVREICFEDYKIIIKAKEERTENIDILQSDIDPPCVNSLDGIIAEKKIIGETFVLVRR